MYKIFLDYDFKKDEKCFPTFDEVVKYMSTIRFPPKRFHVIFLKR